MLGASLSSALAGKAPSEMSALKPYLGKRAVRNFREGDGDNGIIRSPFQRHHSTRPGSHKMLWFRFVFAASLPKSFVIRELCYNFCFPFHRLQLCASLLRP